MTWPIIIELPGEPKGKGRARFSTTHGHVYTPEPTVKYEHALARVARIAMRGAAPLDGPLSVVAVATFGIRPSWPKAKKAEALAGKLPHCQQPDADNVLKMLDAFNHIVWRDDCQVVSASVAKRFGEKPGLCVVVTDAAP